MVVGILSGTEYIAAFTYHEPILIAAAWAGRTSVEKIGVDILAKSLTVGKLRVFRLIDGIRADETESLLNEILNILRIAKPTGKLDQKRRTGSLAFPHHYREILIYFAPGARFYLRKIYA